MLEEILEIIEFEWPTLIKMFVGVGIVVAIILVAWGAFVNWSMSIQPTPIPPVATPTPAAITATPAPDAGMDTITVDQQALSRNHQFPVKFIRDPKKDPEGAWFANLDYGNGVSFPGVYINVPVWKTNGGRILQVTAEGLAKCPGPLYTIYTTKGTAGSQAYYYKQANVIYAVGTPSAQDPNDKWSYIPVLE